MCDTLARRRFPGSSRLRGDAKLPQRSNVELHLGSVGEVCVWTPRLAAPHTDSNGRFYRLSRSSESQPNRVPCRSVPCSAHICGLLLSTPVVTASNPARVLARLIETGTHRRPTPPTPLPARVQVHTELRTGGKNHMFASPLFWQIKCVARHVQNHCGTLPPLRRNLTRGRRAALMASNRGSAEHPCEARGTQRSFWDEQNQTNTEQRPYRGRLACGDHLTIDC